MPSGELDKKQFAHTCGACGQIFDLSITFCPHDGSRLTKELVGATSHDLIKITGTAQSQPKTGADSGQNPKAVTAGQPYLSSSSSSISKADLEVTDPGLPDTSGLDGRTVVNTSGPGRPRATAAPSGDANPHQKENLLGTVLDDKYEILELIGRGGMSLVYKAKHHVLKSNVAIKTLLPHLVLHPMSLQRFHQEAQAASNLRHPNVITVYDFGTTPDGQPYLVMDYVEGFSLGDVLEKEHHLKQERALDIFIQVADALSHAHSKGIIHRDLKPTNILLLEKEGKADFVNIVDFGIAKLLPQEGADAVSLTQTGEVFGSPLYMSPEQCKGEKLDARADIYSMGCLMYETLTGRTPIEGDNTMEVLFKHIHEVPPSMSDARARVPERLERIVFKCLAKDPGQRYQSMEQLKEELETYRSQSRNHFFGTITSRWELFWLKRRPRTLREKVTVALAVLGIGTAIALSGYLGMSYWNAANSQAARTDLLW
ncbi:MAG TPA: serine/threonine-protein kinase, partial [Chroococcales cyanobacterium]